MLKSKQAEIREELLRRNWTQKDLAEITGLSLSTINKVLTGNGKMTVKTENLFRQAGVLYKREEG